MKKETALVLGVIGLAFVGLTLIAFGNMIGYGVFAGSAIAKEVI